MCDGVMAVFMWQGLCVMVMCLCGRVYVRHAETVDQPCLNVCDGVMVMCLYIWQGLCVMVMGLCGRVYVGHAETVDQPCLHVCDGVELRTTIRCGRRTVLRSQVHREPILLPHLESQHGHG